MIKELKYIKHTYNSAIALGWLGVVFGILVLAAVFITGKIPLLVPIIGFLGGAFLLTYGKKLKKNKANLGLAKKELKALIIISAIFLLLSGGLLILLVLVYAILGLNQIKKVQKNDMEKLDSSI